MDARPSVIPQPRQILQLARRDKHAAEEAADAAELRDTEDDDDMVVCGMYGWE